jgi:hypothetical protein
VYFDVFLSYAHEDKADVALPLAQHLRDLGFSVWIDESEMNVGDDISDRIDRALASSDFGVVVLSRHYFNKSWTLRELTALLAKERTKIRVLPVCHGIWMRFSTGLVDNRISYSGLPISLREAKSYRSLTSVQLIDARCLFSLTICLAN